MLNDSDEELIHEWTVSMLNIIIALIIAGLVLSALSSCQSAQTPINVTAVPGNPQSDAVYKYDLFGSVNGVGFDGVGVIPFSPSYAFTIKSKVDVDLLTVQSCHRNFSAESAIKLGWFESKRGYTYNYTPSIGIEDSGSCLVRLGTYNKDKGQNAWGVVDFATPDAVLPAKIYCDGQTANVGGVSICQSKAGLVERIVFAAPVMMAVNSIDPKCKIMQPSDQMTWEYQIASGECILAFMEITKPHRIHRHTTIGYDQVQIRGQ